MTVDIRVYGTKAEMGEAAAAQAAASLRAAIAERGRAHVVAATGASQFEFLDRLVAAPGIDWPRTVFFHLDEYVGLPETHPASFRKYLRERLLERVHPGAFHFIEGDAADPAAECRRVGALLARHPIDVAFVGIGENGHLAFNDPPADFDDRGAVPRGGARRGLPAPAARGGMVRQPGGRAAARDLHVHPADPEVAGDPLRRARRAQGARREGVPCGEVSPRHPASILQRHPRTTVFLDAPAAALLELPSGREWAR